MIFGPAVETGEVRLVGGGWLIVELRWGESKFGRAGALEEAGLDTAAGLCLP
jgi:hypothetical protein